MRITILCVGKLRETWQRDAAQEYMKRLARFDKFDIVEVADFPEPENASDAERRQVTDREGALLLGKIKKDDFVVALCVHGPQPDSVALSDMLVQWRDAGNRVVLVIGGSLGLSTAVLDRANARLSFSNLTFPHALMRIILLEQLFRACKIAANERYHK